MSDECVMGSATGGTFVDRIYNIEDIKPQDMINEVQKYIDSVNDVVNMIKSMELDNPALKHDVKDVFEAIHTLKFIPIMTIKERCGENRGTALYKNLIIHSQLAYMLIILNNTIPEEKAFNKWLAIRWVTKFSEDLAMMIYHTIDNMRCEGLRDLVHRLAIVKSSFFTGVDDLDKETFAEYIYTWVDEDNDIGWIMLMVDHELDQCKTEEDKYKYNIYKHIENYIDGIKNTLSSALYIRPNLIHLGIYGGFYNYDD